MTASITQFVIPNLLFFVAVFLAFSILQSVIVLFLIWLEHENHDRIMVLMLKCYKYYRKIQFIFRMAGAVLIAGAVWIMWSLLKSFVGRPELTFFAVGLLFLITLIYFVLIHLKGRLSLKRRGDGALYFALSLVLYFFIIMLVDQKFPDYGRFVVTNLVDPAVTGVEKAVEANNEEKLLNEFRTMARGGQCPADDYRRERQRDVIHNFVYKATDTEFKIKEGEPIPGDISAIIQGRKCTNGTQTFQLTDYGKWYQVIDSQKIGTTAPQG